MTRTCTFLILVTFTLGQTDAYGRAWIAGANLENEVSDLWREVEELKAKNAELERTVRFIMEHCPEVKAALAKVAQDARDAQAAAAAADQERRRKNRIIGIIAENGALMEMQGGAVLSVDYNSQAYVRRWKPGDTIEVQDEQAAATGRFWIKNPAARKGEDKALVSVAPWEARLKPPDQTREK